MTAPHTIVLKGKGGIGRHEEYLASAALKPGHLLELLSTGKVQKHSGYGGKARMMFAKEDDLRGKIITDAFAADEVVPVHDGTMGDLIYARVPAAAVALVAGDVVISNGDGCLVKATGDGPSDVLYANAADSATVTNTVTETAFDASYTIPANQLRVGDIIRIKGFAIATGTNSTDTLIVKVKIGSTALITTATVDVANNDIAEFETNLVIRTIGSSGTFVAYGSHSLGVPGTATKRSNSVASTTINTTATQAVTVTATWSVADPGNVVLLRALTVERVGSSSREVLAFCEEAVDNSAGVAEAFMKARLCG